MTLEELKLVHKHSSKHRAEIEKSEICGCFYCCETFIPAEIEEWTDYNKEDVGQTALCPKCGIDSVIGSNSGYPIENSLLQEMNKYWF